MQNNRLETASQQLAAILNSGSPSLADYLLKDSENNITQHQIKHAVRMAVRLADELLKQTETTPFTVMGYGCPKCGRGVNPNDYKCSFCEDPRPQGHV